jgi:hypothetical protein
MIGGIFSFGPAFRRSRLLVSIPRKADGTRGLDGVRGALRDFEGYLRLQAYGAQNFARRREAFFGRFLGAFWAYSGGHCSFPW